MSRPKLLVAGGGHADIPMVLAARNLGFHVITSGNRPGDLAHRHADSVELADFSDPGALLEIARRRHISAIVPCCNDFSAISSAQVAAELGLPGHDDVETTCLLHHKDRYRAFALTNGIRTPRAGGFSCIGDALAGIDGFAYPLIVKPVDLTGGKGISTVQQPEELQAALEKAFSASRAARVVVEEFIEGTRHGFTCLLKSGKVVFHFQDNEHYFLNPFMVSAASTPACVPPDTAATLIRNVEHIATLLPLVDGIVHVQYILDSSGPVIIEICRRPPGDLYVRLVQLATGIDYPAQIVRAFAGMGLPDARQVEPDGCYTRHCIMSARAGIVRELRIAPDLSARIIDGMTWWQAGERISDVLTHKLGILFLKFDDIDQMLAETERLQERIRVVLEGDPTS